MCSVSVILDYGMKTPIDKWNFQKYIDFNELVKAAKEYDRRHGEPECETDEKIAWLRELEKEVSHGQVGS